MNWFPTYAGKSVTSVPGQNVLEVLEKKLFKEKDEWVSICGLCGREF